MDPSRRLYAPLELTNETRLLRAEKCPKKPTPSAVLLLKKTDALALCLHRSYTYSSCCDVLLATQCSWRPICIIWIDLRRADWSAGGRGGCISTSRYKDAKISLGDRLYTCIHPLKHAHTLQAVSTCIHSLKHAHTLQAVYMHPPTQAFTYTASCVHSDPACRPAYKSACELCRQSLYVGLQAETCMRMQSMHAESVACIFCMHRT